MGLEFQKEYEDKRGKILFLKYNNKSINIIFLGTSKSWNLYEFLLIRGGSG